jgi:hypothetical protein
MTAERILRTVDLGLPEPSREALDELVADGHARHGFCEKCWGIAYQRLVFLNPHKSQHEHYLDLLAEARGDQQ